MERIALGFASVLVLTLFSCDAAKSEDTELSAVLRGKVIGTYDVESGMLEFDADPVVAIPLADAFARDASVSFEGQTHALSGDLGAISLVPGLTADEQLELTIEGAAAPIDLVAPGDVEEELDAFRARGNLGHKETCQEHWFQGQKNRDKDCKWPWNCRGVYAASHPQYGDGIAARCVCHL